LKKDIHEVHFNTLVSSITTSLNKKNKNDAVDQNMYCRLGDDSSSSSSSSSCYSAMIQLGMNLLEDQGKAEKVFNNPPIVWLLPSVIDTIILPTNDDDDQDNDIDNDNDEDDTIVSTNDIPWTTIVFRSNSYTGQRESNWVEWKKT